MSCMRTPKHPRRSFGLYSRPICRVLPVESERRVLSPQHTSIAPHPRTHSFPMFYAFEEWPQEEDKAGRAARGSAMGLWSAAVDSLGAGMLILCLLDFVRLAVGSDLSMKG